MSEVRRWEHTVVWEGMQISATYMAINDGGEYVMRDDYATLHAEAEALRAQVSALQSDANSWQFGYDKGREDGAKAAEGWKAQHARDSAELRKLCAEREALHAEAEALRAENGRLQADRDRANQYANQQALECNKLSTDLEAARGLLRELRAFTLDHDDGRAGVLRGQIDAFLTATPSPDVPDNQE